MLEPTQYRLNGPPPEPRDTPDRPDELGSGRRTALRGPRTPAGASPGTGAQVTKAVRTAQSRHLQSRGLAAGQLHQTTVRANALGPHG